VKALFRIVHPFGEGPHMLVVPQPVGDVEMEERLKLPTTIRFELTPLNITSLMQDSGDWVAAALRGKLKG